MASAHEISQAALALPPDQRAAFILEACGEDALLRARVESMVEHGGMGSEEGVSADAGSGDDLFLRLRPDELTLPGEREGSIIGRYKLLQRIGEGGMGIVYMAEQDEPVRRRVALKIIKLGMDTRQVVARFESERQALAMMDHPNIAKMLDAGATESGRPYFVMELVQGVPITEFCERNRLSVRERIELFLPVCRAIQSAHQKGIMHRDLKPSNVMVTLHHGDPMPKVIDFGVAKATSQKLTDKTVFTHYGAMIGTPAYMSPEQAEMSSMDVDMRTDVYSLGVLLYELLTGSTPFPKERLGSLGFGQFQRVLVEEEPDKPSTRASTMWKEKRTTIATRGVPGTTGSAAGIPGDLDWIVMKCLEKDRRRRYDTVNGLAMDLQRHLANEPVLARPPSAAYRFQKAFQRHRVAFLGLAGVVVSLAIGLGFATAQAVRARRAEAEALSRQADAEAISRFLTEVFQSPDPERAGYSFTVAEALGRATARLETDLAQQPERRVALQQTLADTYAAIGLQQEAIPLREKFLAHARGQYGESDERTLAGMTALASAWMDAHRFDEGIALQRQVLAAREKAAGKEQEETLAAAEALGYFLSLGGRLDEAGQWLEHVLEVRRRTLGAEHPNTLRALGGLAVHRERAGRGEEALALHEQVLALRRKTLGEEHPETLVALANLAANYHGKGRADEAFALQSELIRLRQKVLGPGHPQTLMARHYLAYFEQERRPEVAVRLHREVADLRRQHLGPENPNTILSLHYLALACLKAGRPEEALPVREEVVRLRRRSNGVSHPHTVDALARLACSYVQAGREAEAVALLAECAPHLSDDTWLSLRVVTMLAWFQNDEACETATRRVLQWAGPEASPLRLAESVEIALLRPPKRRETVDAALAMAQRARDAAATPKDQWHPGFALGLAQLRAGRLEEAAASLMGSAQTAQEDSPLRDAAHLFRAIALHRLGRMPEARTAWNDGTRRLPPVPASGDFTRDGSEARRMVAWLARREAEALGFAPGAAR